MLSVRTKRTVPTNFVQSLIPSAVSRIILVGVRLPVKTLRVLQMIAVEELSTTNSNPYVSQAKVDLSGRSFFANVFTYNVCSWCLKATVALVAVLDKDVCVFQEEI